MKVFTETLLGLRLDDPFDVASHKSPLLTNPDIPFGRVGDDVDIEIVSRQVTS